jgi:lysophospholipase L1-like esterase
MTDIPKPMLNLFCLKTKPLNITSSLIPDIELLADEAIRHAASRFRHVVIYGAGELGQRIRDFLSPLPISCFWDRNHALLCRQNSLVYAPLSGAYPPDDTLVIIGVGNGNHAEEIFRTLEAAGFGNIVFGNDVRFSAILHTWQRKRHIAARLALFRQENRNAEKNGVVFVGDSLIEFFDMQHFQDARVIVHNRGIAGDTAAGLATHLQDSVFDLEPAKIFLLIGSNDLAFQISPDIVARRLLRIVEDILIHCTDHLDKTALHVLAIPPVHEGGVAGERNNMNIQRVNACVRDALRLRQQGSYIDIHERLVDAQGRLASRYTTDGLHLNACGYLSLSAMLTAFL